MTKAYPLKLNKLLLQPKYVKFSYYLTGNACTLIFIKKKKERQGIEIKLHKLLL